MNRLMKGFIGGNINKMIPQVFNRRRKNRRAMWLSLVGAGVVGGATVLYGITRGKNNRMGKMVKQFTNGLNLKKLRIPQTG